MTRDIIDARDSIVAVLRQPTISEARKHFEEEISSPEEFPTSDLIITEKRENILNDIVTKFNQKESPGVILYGSFGSGKTVMMENIETLCEQKIIVDEHEFARLTYGERELDFIKLSLVGRLSINSLLSGLFKKLSTTTDDFTEEDLIEIFNERKEDGLDLDALPDSQRKALEEKYDSPKSSDDIANVVKSLGPGDIRDTIYWFTDGYQERTGRIPLIYIDEFEYLVRHDPDSKTRAIIQILIRDALEGFDEVDTENNPPYVLFANTTQLDELRRGDLGVERDFTERIRQAISHNLDHSPEQTKHLFRELYRLYALPILAEHESDAAEGWYQRLKESSPDSADYVYPFTDDSLSYVLGLIQKQSDRETGETVIRAFRDYKITLCEFLYQWSGEGVIDRTFLFEQGDEVRPRLERGHTEMVEIRQIPGEGTINSRIEEEFSSAPRYVMETLQKLAQKAIIEHSGDYITFSKSDIKSIADEGGHPNLDEDDIETIFQLAVPSEYFDDDDGRIAVEKEVIILEATDEGSRAPEKVAKEIIERHNLDDADMLGLWKDGLKSEYEDMEIVDEDTHLKFPVENQIYYTDDIYFSVNGRPVALTDEPEADAFNFTIDLAEAGDDSDIPLEFSVKERDGRVGWVVDRVEGQLNDQLGDALHENEGSRNLLQRIAGLPGKRYDEVEACWLILKLALLDMKVADEDINEKLNYRLPESAVFDITNPFSSKMDGPTGPLRYVFEELGYNERYHGNEMLDTVYAIKKSRKEETGLIYQQAGDPLIHIHNFSGIGPDNKPKLEFQKFVENKLSSEAFVESANGTYEISDDYSPNMRDAVEAIKEKLEETLSLDSILEELFGTDHVETNAKAAVYLLLVVGDYAGEWVLKDESEIRVVSPEQAIGTRRESVKRDLKQEIQNRILSAAATDAIDSAEIDNLLDDLQKVDSTNAQGLDDIQERLDQLQPTPHQKSLTEPNAVKERLEEIRGSDVLPEKVVNYAADLDTLFDQGESLITLMIEDLNTLTLQLEKSEKVLSKRERVNNLNAKVTALKNLDARPLDSDSIDISWLNGVSEFYEDSDDIREKIEDSSVVDDIEDFLEESISRDILATRLEKTKNSLLPNIEPYENFEEHLEVVEEDITALIEEWETEKEKQEEEVEGARRTLDSYNSQVPSDSDTQNWMSKAKRKLDEAESLLDTELDDFDPDEYRGTWNRWNELKHQIETDLLIGEEEIHEILGGVSVDISPQQVANASSLDPLIVLQRVDDGSIGTLIDVFEEINSSADEPSELTRLLVYSKIINVEEES